MFLSSIGRSFFMGLLLLPPLCVFAQSDKVIGIIGTGYQQLLCILCLLRDHKQ